MNNDLISREALKKAIFEHCRSEEENFYHFWFDENLIALIDNAPTVDIKDQIAGAYNEGYRDAQSKLKPMCKYLTKCMSHPDISREYHDWCVLYGKDCNCQCCSRS